MEETELIEQIKNHEEKAYGIFIGLHKDVVFRICMSFVNSREDAEELTQDVFVEAFTNICSFKKEAKIQTWLYRIAINKSLNSKRKHKNNSLLERLGLSLSVDRKLQQQHQSEVEDSREEKMIVEENNKILYYSIAKLKDDQRIAFTLNKVDGFSYAEVAEIMKISVASVESLIHRGKKKLQGELLKLLDG
jgi:RNA polymerase sigma-70 factor (ECF subfamily)